MSLFLKKLKSLIMMYPLLICGITILTTCLYAFFSVFNQNTNKQQTINNLRTLAKVYGYVRYFHPSDEAALVNWDNFLYHAVEEVQGAKNGTELRKILVRLFQPLAPTMQFQTNPELPQRSANNVIIPDSIWNLYPKFVVWQHQGLGGGNSTFYKSIRVHRTNKQGMTLGGISQKIDARPLQGKEIRLTAQLRGEQYAATASVQLSFGLRAENGKMNLVHSKGYSIKPSWQEYELITSIDQAVKEILFGVSLTKSVLIWADEIRLFSRSKSDKEWQEIAVKNNGFEQGADTLVADWLKSNRSFSLLLTNVKPFSGKQCLEINPGIDTAMIDGRLFLAMPQKGEYIRKKVYDDGKYSFEMVLPVILPANDSVVYSPMLRQENKSPQKSIEQFNVMLQSRIESLLPANKEIRTRYVNVVMVWNIFQHFYPYFDVVGCNWDKALYETLTKVEKCNDTPAFITMMKKMIALVQDGHAAFEALPPLDKRLAALAGFAPLAVIEAEGKIVVTSSLDEKISRGDVLDSINGESSFEYLQKIEEEISGSRQWKRNRALLLLMRGTRGSIVSVKVRQNDKVNTVILSRSLATPLIGNGYRHDAIEELPGNIYYLDMSDMEIQTIEQHLKNLASAKGIILDLRTYPKGSIPKFLSYLTDKPLQSAHWQVPQIIYPDYERVAGFNTEGRWHLMPATPKIRGKVVFLTNSSAISYAESILGIIEHYQLGEIVGEETAGTNGNSNGYNLPGGFRVTWTGMKVLKHDGSQHHLKGIKPTQRVQRSIRGIKEGRDELFDKAVASINSSN